MTVFTQWLKDLDAKNDLEKVMVPETNMGIAKDFFYENCFR